MLAFAGVIGFKECRRGNGSNVVQQQPVRIKNGRLDKTASEINDDVFHPSAPARMKIMRESEKSQRDFSEQPRVAPNVLGALRGAAITPLHRSEACGQLVWRM